MGKKSKTQRGGKPRVEIRAVRSRPNWPLLGLSSVGLLLTGYLTWSASTGSALQGCAAGGGCDIVLTSRWATLLGLPTSLWGLFGYAALAAVSFIRRMDRQWSYAWTVAFFGVSYSIYLTSVSFTVLDSACPYCLTSLGLMGAALALVIWQRPAAMARHSWASLVAGRAAFAALVILVLHLNYSAPQAEPAGPEDPAIRALAEHLTKEGALFYGASWCPHCQEQKRLFGASASRLPYIECSLSGPKGPQASACRSAGVRSYPTWVINGRAVQGQVLTLAELAQASGFPGAASFR
jgi:uncharacterized membrane protein